MSKIDPLVHQYYDAILDSETWNAAVDATRSHFASFMGTLAVLDSTTNNTKFAACGGPAEAIHEVVTKVADKLPFYGVLAKLEIEIPSRMDVVYKLYGPGGQAAQFDGEYGAWSKRVNFQDCFVLAVTRRDNHHGLLNLMINTDRPPISDAELAELGLLAPHIRRAVTIADLFSFRSGTGDFLSLLFDQLNISILVVDAGLRVIHANTKAESDLQTADHIESKGGKLTFKSRHAETAIVEAVAAGQRSEVALAGRGIDVPLAQVSHPAVAHVLPLASRDKRPSVKSVAAIFIAEPGTQAMPVIDAVANLFGLTRAERNVVMQIASGMSRVDIAAANGVKDGTVKAQLNTIFDKTGVSSQRALEQLVRDLAPPILRS